MVAAEPPEVRDFLRRTSVPDLVSAGLAGVLTGETRGGQILERLQRTSGFVTRLGPDSPWFRYHPQLRAALRWQLDLEDPDSRPDLHRATARWYAAKQSVAAALTHAAAAGDWVYLGRLVATQGVMLVVTSDRRLLVEALRRIPPEQFGTTAELMFCAALLRFANGDFLGLPEPLARTQEMLAGRDPARRTATELAASTLEAAAVVRVRGDMPALVRATTGILQRLQAARLDHVPALLHLRALALNNKGVGLFWTDQLDQADRYLWAGLSGARVTGLHLVEINARAHLGLLAFLQGSLAEADEHVTAARGIAARHDLESTPQAMAAHLALALIELERNRVADAQAALRTALHSEANPPEAALAAVASLVRVYLLLAGEDPVAAGAVLRAAREEVGPAVVAPLLDRWLRRCEAEVALAQGAAERVLALSPAAEMLDPAEQACLGRAHLDLGRHAQAEPFLTRAANSPDMVSAVTAWIALALLADGQGHVNRSVNAMSRAATLARRNGIRKPFRTFRGAPIAGLLSRQRWLDDDGFALPDLPDPAELAVAPGAALTVPLSERERDVLRFLPTVLTAHEIAQNLGISVNTVKAHMRAIYRKLDAARRRDAVIVARRHGLL
jgi:LuxR family maltose regulon positive regulatory protein